MPYIVFAALYLLGGILFLLALGRTAKKSASKRQISDDFADLPEPISGEIHVNRAFYPEPRPADQHTVAKVSQPPSLPQTF